MRPEHPVEVLLDVELVAGSTERNGRPVNPARTILRAPSNFWPQWGHATLPTHAPSSTQMNSSSHEGQIALHRRNGVRREARTIGQSQHQSGIREEVLRQELPDEHERDD